MPVLGISIAPTAHKGRPRLSGVLLSGDAASPVVETWFEVVAPDAVETEQIVDLAAGLNSKVSGLTFSAAIVRVAGRSGVPNRRASPVFRGQLEGAAIYVLRSQLSEPVLMRDGGEIATRLEVDSRDAATALGKALVPKAAEAAAAALSAL